MNSDQIAVMLVILPCLEYTLPKVIRHLGIIFHAGHELWSQDNEGKRNFSGKLVRNSYYAGVDHVWVTKQMTLEFGWGYLITFHFNKFL
jgi:hypothetical protein